MSHPWCRKADLPSEREKTGHGPLKVDPFRFYFDENKEDKLSPLLDFEREKEDTGNSDGIDNFYFQRETPSFYEPQKDIMLIKDENPFPRPETQEKIKLLKKTLSMGFVDTKKPLTTNYGIFNGLKQTNNQEKFKGNFLENVVLKKEKIGENYFLKAYFLFILYFKLC